MSRSSPKSSPPLVVDIKMALEMNGSDQQYNEPDLKYGTPSVGKMARTGTSRIVTPMALFQRQDSDLVFEDDGSNESEHDEDHAIRIGITRPSYGADQEDTQAQDEEVSRIGISPASYDRPEGALPLSPLTLMKRIDQWSFTSPVSVIDNGPTDAYGNTDIWWKRVHEQSPLALPPTDSSSPTDHFDGAARMLHPHTANGHFLVSSAPLSVPPMDGLRYSLSKGMAPEMKKEISCPRLLESSFRSNDSSFRLNSSHRRMIMNDSMSILSNNSSGSIVQYCSDPFKIFVLLLHPRAKIFELIQLVYAPSATTVGDILEMIPTNATEPALGNQTYYGLCRPKDGEEIIDLERMASGSGGEGCARITRGEILVAIPEHYTGRQIAKYGMPLLGNKKIVKLLKKSDPLAAKKIKPKPPRPVQEENESDAMVELEEPNKSKSAETEEGSDDDKEPDETVFGGVNLSKMTLDDRLNLLRMRSLKKVENEPILEDID